MVTAIAPVILSSRLETTNGQKATATIIIAYDAYPDYLNLTEKSLNKGETVTLEVTFTPDVTDD